MRIPSPTALRPTQATDPEWMDEPGLAPDVLAANLEDLRRVNRWLGGAALTLRGLEALAPRAEALSVVDVATGGADIPRAVVDWAQRRGTAIRVVATDLSDGMLAVAARRQQPGIVFARADARELPFADGSFDVATCSLVLHHFDAGTAVTVLREMGRVARLGVVVNDLVRTWHGYVGALVLGRVFTRNAISRHDGPLSVRRAYTRGELLDLARRAGLVPLRMHGTLGYRVALVAKSAA